MPKRKRTSRKSGSSKRMNNVEPRSQLAQQFKSQKIYRKTQRYFVSTNNNSALMYNQELLLSVGGMATTATNLAPMAESFKLNRVRVWGSPSSVGTACSVQVNWFPSASTSLTYVPGLEYISTSCNTAVNAYISCKPPKNSLASFWQNSQSNLALFKLTVPAGGIIELDVSFILLTNDLLPTAYTTSTTMSVGYVYVVALDASTHSITPIGVPFAY